MKIYIFYCSNCVDANTLRQHLRIDGSDEIMTVSLPCSGKVNLLYLLKAFEKDADGLLLITCGQNQCHFLEGNLRAKKRAEAVDTMLQEIGLGKGRIKDVQNNDSVETIMPELEQLKKDLSQLEKR